MESKSVPAPATGQAKIRIASPPRALVDSNRTANVIIFSPDKPRHVDARAGRASLRYTSDPTTGIWRVLGTGPREQVSPFALTRIEVGGRGIAVVVTHPKTGIRLEFEGNADTTATALWRAGQRYGCQAERKIVFWALREFSDQARRQAAARGCSL